MKRRFLSFVLVLCMLLTLHPTVQLTVSAYEEIEPQTDLPESEAQSVLDEPEMSETKAAAQDSVLSNDERTTHDVRYKSDTDIAYPVEDGNIYFDKESGTITYCDWSVTKADIPAEIEGVAVTTIGYKAFNFCDKLTSVTIPDSVTSIGLYVFYLCSSLTGIWVDENNESYSNDSYGVLFNKDKTELIQAPGAIGDKYSIPNGVTTIKDSAFAFCQSLISVVIPSTVENIEFQAFRDCSATSVTISNGVKSIADYTFSSSGLTQITIPASVTTIGEGAFNDCPNLTGIWVDENNPTYSNDSYGVLFSNDKTELIQAPGALCGEYTISEGVTEICYAAFERCTDLTNITIADSVTSIGGRVFICCDSLTSVTIPDAVTIIGWNAFYGCSNLTSIYFLGDAPEVYGEAFEEDIVTLYYIDGKEGWTTPEWNGYQTAIWDGVNFPEIASGVCGADDDNLTWRLGVDGTLTISGVGEMEDYGYSYSAPWYYYSDKIIDLVLDSGVTSIGDWAFYDCPCLTSVTIPDSVTSIGYFAFYRCLALTNVLIPDGVTYMGSGAFSSCTSLSSVTIGNSLTSISDQAFMNCTSLSSVIIPDSVKTIGNFAFDSCTNLSNVTIGNRVTEIGYHAFYNCANLTNVVMGNSLDYIGACAFQGCISLPGITLPDSVTTIKSNAFYYCPNLTSIKIPASVKEIGSEAFIKCTNLEEIIVDEKNAHYCNDDFGVLFNKDKTKLIQAPRTLSGEYVIPSSVTEIGYKAFHECTGLTSVTIPNSVTYIRGYAFDFCSSLTSILIPDSVETVGYNAFRECTGIESIVIGSGLKELVYPYSAPFSNCTALTGIWVDEANEYFSSDSHGVLFNKDKTRLIKAPDTITDYVIPNSVTEIYYYAFAYCTALEHVTIGTSVSRIYESAFQDCTGLKSIIIPDNVTGIDLYAFYNCTSLTSVIIGNGIDRIYYDTFESCTNLKDVTIGYGVAYISSDAFSDCHSLQNVYFLGDAPQVNNSFDYSSILKMYYIAEKSGWTSPEWNGYTTATWDGVNYPVSTAASGTCGANGDNLTWEFTDNGVLTINGSGAMASFNDVAPWDNYSKSIIKVVLPDGLTNIGAWAFSNCDILTSINIPSSVMSIEEGAFWYCTSLSEVVLPDELYSIGRSAFAGCSSLTEIALPDGLTVIESGLFSGCTALTDISIPESVESIERYAFSYCLALESVELPNSVEYIGESAFENCYALTMVRFGSNLETIDNEAFFGCMSLQCAEFMGDAPNIGLHTFEFFYRYYNYNYEYCYSAIPNLTIFCFYTNDGWTTPTWNGFPTATLTHEHDYAVAVTEPTCTEKGYTTYTCSICGDSYISDYVEAMGHDYTNGECTRCGETDPDYVAPTMPSVEPTEPNVKPSEPNVKPTEPGIEPTEPTVEPTEPSGKPHKHDYSAVITAPTCTEKGYTVYTCACGESYRDDYTDALGHDYDHGECTRCGANDPDYMIPSADFKDVSKDAWYKSAVDYAVDKGLMNGMGNNTFEPDTPTNRAMLVTVLWRYAGSPVDGTNTFSDVPNGQWYTQAVAWAAKNGIVSGMGNNKFEPDGTLTREQLATILFRYAKLQNLDTSARADFSKFEDGKKVQSWSKDAVQWAVAEGIIGGTSENGKLYLDPQGNATRAQVATILMRFIENVLK